jgi:transcriptional regulator with XRE-family HTH domain
LLDFVAFVEYNYYKFRPTKGITMGDFADRLKISRTKAGLTQKELAEKVHIATATISSYENGPNMPSLQIAIELARACGVTLDSLCGLSYDSANDFTTYRYKSLLELMMVFVTLTNTLNCNIEVNELNKNKKINITVCEAEDILYYAIPSVNIQETTYYQNVQALFQFLKEWSLKYNMYKNDTIDRDLYNFWLEKKLDEYSKIPIEEETTDSNKKAPRKKSK